MNLPGVEPVYDHRDSVSQKAVVQKRLFTFELFHASRAVLGGQRHDVFHVFRGLIHVGFEGVDDHRNHAHDSFEWKSDEGGGDRPSQDDQRAVQVQKDSRIAAAQDGEDDQANARENAQERPHVEAVIFPVFVLRNIRNGRGFFDGGSHDSIQLAALSMKVLPRILKDRIR